MTHSEMIKEISGQYGGHMLIKMLDHYHVDGLRELTEEQIQKYLDKIKKEGTTNAKQ